MGLLLTPFGKHMIDFFNSICSWELLLFNFSKEEDKEEDLRRRRIIQACTIHHHSY
jgi:hypothetical protein